MSNIARPLSRRLKAASKPRPQGRRQRPNVELLEERQLLATVQWISTTGGNWDDAANWSTGQVPGTGDDVVIDVSGGSTHDHDRLDDPGVGQLGRVQRSAGDRRAGRSRRRQLDDQRRPGDDRGRFADRLGLAESRCRSPGRPLPPISSPVCRKRRDAQLAATDDLRHS